jgi:hypothetical protein
MHAWSRPQVNFRRAWIDPSNPRRLDLTPAFQGGPRNDGGVQSASMRSVPTASGEVDNIDTIKHTYLETNC